MCIFSVFLSNGLYMEPRKLPFAEHGGLGYLQKTKVSCRILYHTFQVLRLHLIKPTSDLRLAVGWTFNNRNWTSTNWQLHYSALPLFSSKHVSIGKLSSCILWYMALAFMLVQPGSVCVSVGSNITYTYLCVSTRPSDLEQAYKTNAAL